MNVNANNHIKTIPTGAVHSDNTVLPFGEGTRLNTAVLRMMNNRTIVRLTHHQSGQSVTVTVPQLLSPDKVWTARIVGGKPVFTEVLRQNVKTGTANTFIDTLLGSSENADTGNSILNMLGGILGLNDANRINKEDNRRNCLSFSDERGHYYFIFRLPTDGTMAKFVIRIDEQLNTVINIYTETDDQSCIEHLTDRMRHLRSSLGTIAASLNFAIFTEWTSFRTECEQQFGLSGIDIMG